MCINDDYNDKNNSSDNNKIDIYDQGNTFSDNKLTLNGIICLSCYRKLKIKGFFPVLTSVK